MRLILGQPVDKIAVESPIVFGGMKSHGCPIVARRFRVISDFGPIGMKFGMKVEIDALNHCPKFHCDQMISCPVGVVQKNSANTFPLSDR